ncbi:MAG TPA: hypothetical protein VFV48_08175 [Pseudomonadales bacterium]|nr:hypothetical protein [Pseudomonadales bacterium]
MFAHLRSFFKRVSLMALILSLAACANSLAVYKGAKQPAENLATVKSAVSWLTVTPFAVEFRKVDGAQVGRYVRSVALLPGPHQLEVLCYLEREDALLPYLTTVQLTVEAQKVYQLYSVQRSDRCDVSYDVSLK